jgi:hypothetical protein
MPVPWRQIVVLSAMIDDHLLVAQDVRPGVTVQGSASAMRPPQPASAQAASLLSAKGRCRVMTSRHRFRRICSQI